MSYSFYNDSVLAYWVDRPLTAEEVFAQVDAFLRRLQSFSDVFSQIYAANLNTRRYVPLSPDFSNLPAELIAGQNPERGFVNEDPEAGSFSMTSRAIQGFGGDFATVPKNAQTGCWLGVKCGVYEGFLSENSPNMVDITVSPGLATPEFLRGLLEQTVAFWRPADAAVTRTKVSLLLEQPIGEARPGWLTYIADPTVAGAVPRDMPHEPLADGILIQAADRPGKEDDAAYVARLIRLRDALRPAGFLARRRELSTNSAKYDSVTKSGS